VYVVEVAGATLPWFCGSGSISLSMLLSTTPTEMLHRRLQLSSGLYYHYYNNVNVPYFLLFSYLQCCNTGGWQ